ncbi:hypothetical protein [Roseateles toxinivorans]|uniref:hypothetical protein n=1 Tax=Roseateles toxinivorans TaxID=270368 RepID=UPI001414EFD1|nr:hypothetical protein [Roseateles toxinivorans]
MTCRFRANHPWLWLAFAAFVTALLIADGVIFSLWKTQAGPTLPVRPANPV